ncbi:lipid A phosphoethanolamine transferase [Flavobacterium sp. N3904]|uniref:lipid A phosphoethanolamine transferase n=1 Tax=Flavobacterium sp. N3904 TaxID=2986835 RepID=UPI0022255DDC|nr:lipid A phosphoethanolamine transferase [Flavobacterium sp. N3904]
MKNILYLLSINLLFICSLQAQEDAVAEINPFADVRYNYFKKTVILFNEYLNTDSGSFNTTDFRILEPIGKKDWNLRLDVPLVSTNTNSINKTGLGDISFATSYIIALNNKRGIGARAKVISNSASNPSFGSGKWVFVPTLFYGLYIDKSRKLLWLTDVEYQVSFAGSSNRNDISTSVFENALIFSFQKNWIAGNVAFRYNDVINGFQNSAYLEFGRKFSKESMFYIHPSIGFGDKKAYNNGLELGLVILY